MSRETEQRNIKFIETLFAATGSGDWATAATMITEDFFVTEADSLPFAGVYRGLQGFKDLYATVMSCVAVVGLETRQMTAGGDWVVSLVDMLLEGTPPIRCPLAESFRFRDGKVCEIKPYYFDPRPLLEAAARKRGGK